MFSIDFTLTNFEYFLLILARIASFVVVAPFFNLPNVPNMTKVGFSALLSIMLYYLVDFTPLNYTTVTEYAFLVVKEVITGLMIGYCGNLCNYIIIYAGNIIDMDIGISMASEFDPTMGTEVTVTGNLYQYFVLMLLVVGGFHHYVLQAICDSFTLIPIGGTVFHYDSLLATMGMFMVDIFVIAFRIFLPIFAVIMILNSVLGVMAKVSPQMNMFAIGVQLKVLTGFAVLFLTTFLLPEIVDMIFKEVRIMFTSVIEGLM